MQLYFLFLITDQHEYHPGWNQPRIKVRVTQDGEFLVQRWVLYELFLTAGYETQKLQVCFNIWGRS